MNKPFRVAAAALFGLAYVSVVSTAYAQIDDTLDADVLYNNAYNKINNGREISFLAPVNEIIAFFKNIPMRFVAPRAMRITPSAMIKILVPDWLWRASQPLKKFWLVTVLVGNIYQKSHMGMCQTPIYYPRRSAACMSPVILSS